jgi:hypothetical protein
MGAAPEPGTRRREAELALAAYKREWDARNPSAVVGKADRPAVPPIPGRMAVAAFEAGRLGEASEYAQEAIRLAWAWTVPAGSRFASWSQPLNEEWARGQQVLGRLALARGDADEAERRLRSTFQLGTLFTAPPRFELAAELVRAGRRDAVLDYIRMCKRVRRRIGHLDEWLREVERGEVPHAWSTYPPR